MVMIINCILSSESFPNKATSQAFIVNSFADCFSQFIHCFLVCRHLPCNITRSTFSSIFQRVFKHRFEIGINARVNFKFVGADGYLVLPGLSLRIPKLML